MFTERISKFKYIYLSYFLKPGLSAYRNSDRIKIKKIRSIKDGDSSNNSYLQIPSHYGTHIDFPYHFSMSGKKGESYLTEHFVFKNVKLIDITNQNINDYLIKPSSIQNLDYNNKTEAIIVKTGFCYKRYSEEYWKNNWGFAPEVASFLKNYFPNLRLIGFDLISLSSYQQREIGRCSHREFLINNNILIAEDMDLTKLNYDNINMMVVSPMIFENCDGTPVSIIAEIER